MLVTIFLVAVLPSSPPEKGEIRICVVASLLAAASAHLVIVVVAVVVVIVVELPRKASAKPLWLLFAAVAVVRGHTKAIRL